MNARICFTGTRVQRLRATLIVVTWMLPGLATGQAANEWHGPEHLYRSTCIYCHETGVGPTLKGRGQELSASYIYIFLRKGSGPMPAFKPSAISDADAKALADWLIKGESEQGVAD